MHHSSTSPYIPNFVEIEETFCGRTGVRTDGRADGHLRPTLLGRLGGVDLKITSRPLELRSIVIGMPVCLYECLSL